MKVFVVLALFVGAASAIPQGMISPAMRAMMQDMLKNMLRNMGVQKPAGQPRPPPIAIPPIPPPNNFPPRQPSPIAPPGNAFAPPMGGGPPGNMGHHPPSNNNNGLFMDLPPGPGGFGYLPPKEYCPPGAPPGTLNDSCKEQVLIEALYFPSGKPRYKWIHYPLRRWDPSVPDNVKDMAQRVLQHKIGHRQPTPKEAELLAILGDINHMGPRFG